MKMRFKLGGIAIGLIAVVSAKLIIIEAKDRILELHRQQPMQLTIDREMPQMSRSFSPKFDGDYDLNFIPSKVKIGENLSVIEPPSIQVEIVANGREIDVRNYQPSSCKDLYRYTCKVASFRGDPGQNYTIIINTKNIDLRWFAFKPIVETDLSTSYYQEYRTDRETKAGYLLISGISILFISVMMLAIDPIVRIYQHKN